MKAQKRGHMHLHRAILYTFSVFVTAVFVLFLILGAMDIEARAEWVGEPEPSNMKTAGKSAVVIAWPEDNLSQATPEIYFPISDLERLEIERCVMAEAGAECFQGQMAVAQCILDGAIRDGISPVEALDAYGYTSARKEPSDSVRSAVSAVFDRGEMAVDGEILYFYAPLFAEGEWHEENAVYVATIGGHRFFR
ncbi:MAG TPA: cell wall hydrolase [Clostridia bacterium]|nr:cell wall hydrolase [Clostridia bacterium]